MECRAGCAACCIVISISSSLPGMPGGKPAGVRCLNLDDSGRCRIHGTEHYPRVCKSFSPSPEMCGSTNDHADSYLKELEELTS